MVSIFTIGKTKSRGGSCVVWIYWCSAPVFNRDSLQEFASLVGHSIVFHPSTTQLTNIDIAKVYMVIDHQKPLSDFANARLKEETPAEFLSLIRGLNLSALIVRKLGTQSLRARLLCQHALSENQSSIALTTAHESTLMQDGKI